MSLVTPSLINFRQIGSDKAIPFGKVYVGLPDLDARTNPKQAQIRKEDGTTVNVSQPIILSGGGYVIDESGNYAVLLTDGDFSIQVDSRNDDPQYYIPNNEALIDASQISISINGFTGSLSEYLKSQTLDLNSVADLLATTPDGDFIKLQQYTAGTNKGGHERYRDGTTGTPSTISNGIIYDASGAGWDIYEEIITPDMFGSIPDDSTDNYQSISEWVTYLIAKKKEGYAVGVYRYAGSIVLPLLTVGLNIRGAGTSNTIFKQITDDTPCITFGDADTGILHTNTFTDIGFGYVNDQTGNTNAACLYFRANDTFYIHLDRIKFHSGYTGIKIRSGANCPWGCKWGDIKWGGGIVGNAVDSAGSTSATPNNDYGPWGIDCSGMTGGTILNELKGYNNHVSSIEIFGGNTNQRLASFQAGSKFTISSLKCETITLDAAILGNALITAPVNGYVKVDQLDIGGTVCKLTPTNPTGIIGGPTKYFEVGYCSVGPSEAPSNMYLSSTGGKTVIDYVDRDSTYPIPYTNLAGTTAAEGLTIRSIVNRHLSPDIGDADYSANVDDTPPTTIMYESALTADRSVEIPGADGDLFNGMTYTVVASGKGTSFAINIVSDGATRASIAAGDDNVSVTLKYRRHPTGAAGWNVINRGTT